MFIEKGTRYKVNNFCRLRLIICKMHFFVSCSNGAFHYSSGLAILGKLVKYVYALKEHFKIIELTNILTRSTTILLSRSFRTTPCYLSFPRGACAFGAILFICFAET